MTSSHRSRWIIYGGLLLVIVIVGIAIRLAFMSRPMFYDEALSFLEYAQTSLPRLIARYNTPNNHIFHSVLMWVSYHLFDSAEPWVLRLPVFIAGIVSIPAAYLVGGRFYHPRVGLLTAGLVAVSLPMIDYSVNARGYSILVLIVLLMLLLAHRLKTGGRGLTVVLQWTAFAVLAALGFWTIPTMVYPMGVIAVWLGLSILLENKGASRVRRLIGFAAALIVGAALTVVLYLPVIQTFGINALIANDFVVVRTLPIADEAAAAPTLDLARAAPVASGDGIPVRSVGSFDRPPLVATYLRLLEIVTIGVPLLAAVVLLVGALIGVILHRRVSADRVPLLIAAALWLIPLTILYPVVLPTRTWLFIVPVVAMTAAAGLDALFTLVIRRNERLHYTGYALTGAALIAVIGASVYTNRETLYDFQTDPAPDAEAVALALNDVVTPDDFMLVHVPYYAPVRYYMALNGVEIEDDAMLSEYGTYPAALRDILGHRVYVYTTFDSTLEGIAKTYSLSYQDLNVALVPIAAYNSGALFRLDFSPAVEQLDLYLANFDDALETAFTLTRFARFTDSGALQVGRDDADEIINVSPGRGEYWVDTRTTLTLTLDTVPDALDSPSASVSVRARRRFDEVILALDAASDTVTLGIGQEGVITRVLASESMSIETSTPYTITILVEGSTIEAQINNTVLSADDLAAPEQGTFRINTAPGVIVEVDDIRVMTP